jgi:hypothetical protein
MVSGRPSFGAVTGDTFAQISVSAAGVVRGIHYANVPPGQANRSPAATVDIRRHEKVKHGEPSVYTRKPCGFW